MPKTETPQLTIPVGENDHIQGTANADVTLVEYGDYECPYCGRAYWIVKKVQEKMGDRLRFVFRHFPLTQAHPHALHAAEAAEIAASQDKFWEMHDRLFENQNALDDESLIAYAEGIGLDVEKFTEHLRSDTFEEKVRADFMGGVESGVNGTPTFFIDGVRFNQAWDYETLLEALERGQHSSRSGASA